jgi:hypothetical protein
MPRRERNGRQARFPRTAQEPPVPVPRRADAAARGRRQVATPASHMGVAAAVLWETGCKPCVRQGVATAALGFGRRFRACARPASVEHARRLRR